MNSPSFETSLARIRTQAKSVVGAGFLAGGAQVITNAHVVNQALGRSPQSPGMPTAEELVCLDFPLVGQDSLFQAHVIRWELTPDGGAGDLAVLELTSPPPPGAQPAGLVSSKETWNHTFRAFGFPRGFDNGVWASGRVLGRDAAGWLQTEDVKETGYTIAPGFSGTPVWDDLLGGVIGIVVVADTTPGVRTAFIIPSELISNDVRPAAFQPRRIFICYKRNTHPDEPDEPLAQFLFTSLSAKGHTVFIDKTIRAGASWLDEIDQNIKTSDCLVALLSESSANSQMVKSEILRAYQYGRRILPVRVRYEGLLPYALAAFLNPLQYSAWKDASDNQRLADEILAAVQGNLPDKPPALQEVQLAEMVLTEDGRRVQAGDERLHPPLPEFDPRFLEELEEPGGAVKPRDRLYIERDADERLRKEIIKTGTTTTIRAARQTGKSSLMVRGLAYAREKGIKIVPVDVQSVGSEFLKDADVFLRYLSGVILRRLSLNPGKLDEFWQGQLGPQDKLTSLMEDYVLPETNAPVLLAMDEVDRLLQSGGSQGLANDFFSLVRSWHNARAFDERWDRFNIAMVISTEPDLLIRDINQSPFNVGLRVYLKDFNEAQVADLNARHGSPVRPNEINAFLKLFGGHPYLIRKALYTLVTEKIGWDELARTADDDHGPFGDHLRHYHWLLREEPELRTGLRNIIRDGRCADEQMVFRLLRAGLVKSAGDVCTCRCDLYRLYFKDKL